MVKDERVVTDEKEFLQIEPSTESWNIDYTDAHFIETYDLHGVAYRATNKISNLLTKNNWESNSAAFEKARKEIDFDNKLGYATERAFVLGYSLIFMEFLENGASEDKLAEPIDRAQIPVKLTVVPKTWIREDLDEDFREKGTIRDYYVLNKIPSGDLIIHESRMIRIQLRNDRQSMLTPAMRGLKVTDDILWSTGQSFFRQAAGYTHLSIEKPRVIKGADGIIQNEVKYLQDNNVLQKITGGTGFISDERAKLEVKGIQGTKLTAIEHWNIGLQAVSMALEIPWQLLVGSNAGSVSGSETNIKDFYGDLTAFREVWLKDMLKETSVKWGFDNLDFNIENLYEETDLEKSDLVKNMSEAFDLFIRNGTVSRESVNALLNDATGYELELGVPEGIAGTDSADSCKCGPSSAADVHSKSKVLKRPILKLVDKAEEDMLKALGNNFKFPGLIKSLRGSVSFKDSIKDMRLVYNIGEDAEEDAKRLIDAQVDKFKADSEKKLDDDLEKMWDSGIVVALGEIGEKNLINPDRVDAIKKVVKDSSFDLVAGATEDMRKDLKFQLSQSLSTKTNARDVAADLKKYVSTDFARKYKNRMVTIARNEMNGAFNKANMEAYKDSPVVGGKEWIHSGLPNERKSHKRADGEIVGLDETFSNGCFNAPCGVNCRCSIGPVLLEDMPGASKE